METWRRAFLAATAGAKAKKRDPSLVCLGNNQMMAGRPGRSWGRAESKGAGQGTNVSTRQTPGGCLRSAPATSAPARL